jgi:transcriptional regulator with XRE-family HTH domain
VSELIEHLRQSFTDEEYRNAYAESFMNSYVAAQIKVLREAYPLTQDQLAEKIGTQQPGVARLENVNYSSWKVESLRKLARALKVRLKITFEEFGTLPGDIDHFNREALRRAPFHRDPVFSPAALPVAHADLPEGNRIASITGHSAGISGVSATAQIGPVLAGQKLSTDKKGPHNIKQLESAKTIPFRNAATAGAYGQAGLGEMKLSDE